MGRPPDVEVRRRGGTELVAQVVLAIELEGGAAIAEAVGRVHEVAHAPQVADVERGRQRQAGACHRVTLFVEAQVLGLEIVPLAEEPVPAGRRHPVGAFVVGGHLGRVEGAHPGKLARRRAHAVAHVDEVRLHRRGRQLAEELVGRGLGVRDRPEVVHPLRGARPQQLARRVEEQPVLENRPAEGIGRHPPVGVLERQRRLGLRNQRLRNGLEPEAAAQLVGARPCHRVGHEPRRPPELGRDGAPLHVELGDVELVHLGAQVTEARVGDVHTVDEIGVVLAARTAVGREAVVLGHSGYQLKQARVGALQRQFLDEGRVVVEVHLGALEIDGRVCRAHLHRLIEGDAEDDIGLRVPVDLHHHGASCAAHAVLADGHFIRSRQQQGEPVRAVLVGGGRTVAWQRRAGERHHRAFDHRAAHVEDDPRDRTGIGGSRGRCAQQDAQHAWEPALPRHRNSPHVGKDKRWLSTHPRDGVEGIRREKV